MSSGSSTLTSSLGDPGTRWYHVRLPRADTFSTWTPGSAVQTLATRRPHGKRKLSSECPVGLRMVMFRFRDVHPDGPCSCGLLAAHHLAGGTIAAPNWAGVLGHGNP